MTALGEALKRRREELGVSQERAAVALDTSSNTYAKWESGENPPRKFSWVEPIADWLGDDVAREDVALMILVDLDRLSRRGPGYRNRLASLLSSPSLSAPALAPLAAFA